MKRGISITQLCLSAMLKIKGLGSHSNDEVNALTNKNEERVMELIWQRLQMIEKNKVIGMIGKMLTITEMRKNVIGMT